MTTKVSTLMLESLAPASPSDTDATNSGKVVQLSSTGYVPDAYVDRFVDQWRMTADLVNTADPISANLTRGLLFGSTGMTVAAGVWTFPSTGIYRVSSSMSADLGANAGGGAATGTLHLTTNANDSEGASWSEISSGAESGNSSTEYGVLGVSSLIDVTAVADVKVKFAVTQTLTTNSILGHATSNRTFFTFEKLGGT